MEIIDTPGQSDVGILGEAGIPMNLLAVRCITGGMPYRCKPSLEKYLCGCDISVGCIAAIVTRVHSF